jgi:hypothetical protein
MSRRATVRDEAGLPPVPSETGLDGSLDKVQRARATPARPATAGAVWEPAAQQIIRINPARLPG